MQEYFFDNKEDAHKKAEEMFNNLLQVGEKFSIKKPSAETKNMWKIEVYKND